MIKVQARSQAYTAPFANKNLNLKDMRDWCREEFGKNPRTGPKIWMSTVESEFTDETPKSSWLRWQSRLNIPTFYFIDQRHATAFLLRWG
jgi:hypothetical protein